jgi:hypothetical protein
VIYHEPIPLKKPVPGAYKKPDTPAMYCIRTIIQINDFNAYDPENQCLGCDPVQDDGCPTQPAYGINPKQITCQDLIKDLHWNCDGVTLPDGYYYDPQRTITGTWGAEVKMRLNVAIGRCGCRGSWGHSVKPRAALVAGIVAAVGLLVGLY